MEEQFSLLWPRFVTFLVRALARTRVALFAAAIAVSLALRLAVVPAGWE